MQQLIALGSRVPYLVVLGVLRRAVAIVVYAIVVAVVVAVVMTVVVEPIFIVLALDIVVVAVGHLEKQMTEACNRVR